MMVVAAVVPGPEHAEGQRAAASANNRVFIVECGDKVDETIAGMQHQTAVSVVKPAHAVMVEPRVPGHHIYSRYPVPGLALPTLGALAAARGAVVRIYCEMLKPVTDAALAESGLVCLSAFTYNAPAAYALADRARAAVNAVNLADLTRKPR